MAEPIDFLNKIHLADCMDILRQLPDKSVDLVLTDPPYGMEFVSGRRKVAYAKMEGDNGGLDWLPEWLEQVDRVSKDDAIWLVFCSWHNVDIFKREVARFRKVKNILVWVKNNHGAGDLFCDFAPQYELVLFCNPGRKRLNGKRPSTVLRYGSTGNKLHPTQKPVDMFEELIKITSNENDIVLDPFSGSGTTAVACRNTGRQFILVEKDPRYHAESIKRLRESTDVTTKRSKE